jgi:hypothetical protein
MSFVLRANMSLVQHAVFLLSGISVVNPDFRPTRQTTCLVIGPGKSRPQSPLRPGNSSYVLQPSHGNQTAHDIRRLHDNYATEIMI